MFWLQVLMHKHIDGDRQSKINNWRIGNWINNFFRQIKIYKLNNRVGPSNFVHLFAKVEASRRTSY
jgi:hypothetical protein